MVALSKDQMHAVMHGTNPNQSWDVVELPQWPFELPSWVKDFRVDWMDGYANRPHYYIMVNGDYFEQEDAVEWLYDYDQKLGAYISRRDDRCKVHYHSALQSEIDYEIQFLGWGQGPGKRGSNPGYAERCAERERRWATGISQGYAGRHFPITMSDGRKAILRGPWHGGAPTGYTEATLVPDKLNGQPQRYMHKKRKEHYRKIGRRFKWDQTGYFGTYVTEDLIARCLARFQPHLRLARVRLHGWEDLEPRFAGQPPKNMAIEGQDLSGD